MIATDSSARNISDALAALHRALSDVIDEDGLILDIEERRGHSTDLLDSGETCDIVVRPQSVDALARAVALTTAAGFAIAPRGGGLTYVRGYTPAGPRTVAIDLRRLDRIVEVNARNMYVTVEAGATWRQIHAALTPLGLRLPFFGTFSGRSATIGGGLSNGALFLGTARYATAAETVLGLDVVLADGSLLRTGQTSVANANTPFFRAYGPDTTGLFVHDAGSLGIKARATLRIIRRPAETSFLSFGFEDAHAAIEALSEVGRAELAEDAYVMDPNKTRMALAGDPGLIADARMLAKVVRQEKGLRRGLKAGSRLAIAGREFVETGIFSIHLVCAGRSRAAVEADMAACRAIAAGLGGRELPDSIPRATRADLFPPLNMVMGPDGDRWIALNAKVAHSEARALFDDVEGLIAIHAEELARHGVVVSRLLTVISNHAFSYEPVFNWRDEWLPMHRSAPEPAFLARMTEPAPNPEARALVMRMREEIIAIFTRHGAASNQIGRTYPYLLSLREEPRALMTGIKRQLDPRGLMNPGALGL